jgi:hypothetical protein
MIQHTMLLKFLINTFLNSNLAARTGKYWVTNIFNIRNAITDLVSDMTNGLPDIRMRPAAFD